MPAPPSDLEVLLPEPKLWRLAGEELRQTPLPVRRLLEVMRFVKNNADLFEKAKFIGKPETEGGVDLIKFVEGDVYTRLNALLRMLMPTNAALLTDDWCADHLTNAHYAAILKTALVQNQLYELFSMAKGYVGQFVVAALRQNAPPPPGPEVQN